MSKTNKILREIVAIMPGAGGNLSSHFMAFNRNIKAGGIKPLFWQRLNLIGLTKKETESTKAEKRNISGIKDFLRVLRGSGNFK